MIARRAQDDGVRAEEDAATSSTAKWNHPLIASPPPCWDITTIGTSVVMVVANDDNDDFGGWMLTFEGRADAAYLDVVGIQGAYTNRK